MDDKPDNMTTEENSNAPLDQQMAQPQSYDGRGQKPKIGKGLIIIHIVFVLLIVGLGFLIYFEKDSITSLVSNVSNTKSKDSKISASGLKMISFNASVEAPVSFKYPSGWTVARDNTSQSDTGNPNGLYDSIMITSPSKAITVGLRADHGFLGVAGGCTADGAKWSELPDDVVKLDKYPGIYYVELVNQYDPLDTSKGLMIDAHLSKSTPCLGSQIVYNTPNYYYFTAYIDVKEFDRYIDGVEVTPQVVVTQSMIDRVIASDDFKTAKAILLSTMKTE